MENTTKAPFINDRVYDTLKWIVQIFIPGLSALYFGLANTWDWTTPDPGSVVATASLVAAFLGVLIGINKKRADIQSAAALAAEIAAGPPVASGELVATFDDEGVPGLSFRLSMTPEEIAEFAKVEFDVVKQHLSDA